jgi:hypothetical protein
MVIVRTKIANESRVLKFTEEAEAVAVENAIADQSKYYEAKLAEVQETRDKALEATAMIEKRLEFANAKIAELSNPDVQADLIQEAAEQVKAEKAILSAIRCQNADDEDDKDDVENEDDDEEVENVLTSEEGEKADTESKSVENEDDEEDVENEDDTDDEEVENKDDDKENTECSGYRKNVFGNKSLAKRRADTVRKVANANGMRIPKNWKQEQFDAAFATLAMQAKKAMKKVANAKKSAKKGNKVPAGGVTAKTNNGLMGARERMLAPMKAFAVNGNK